MAEFDKDQNQEEAVWREKIEKSVKVEVPDSLKPQQVEKLLEQRKPKKNLSRLAGYAAAAAVVVLGLGAAVWGWNLGRSKYADEGKQLSAGSKSAVEEIEGLRQAESYDQVKKLLRQYYDTIYVDYAYTGSSKDLAVYDDEEFSGEIGGYTEADESAGAINGVQGAAEDDMPFYSMEGLVSTEEETERDYYSKTNVREEGVEEADKMLTDGTYIYQWTGEEKVTIIEAGKEDGSMNQLSEISFLSESGYDTVAYHQEMYLYKDSLTMVYDSYEEDTWRINTFAVTYDISDRANPVKAGEIVVEGSYMDSRMVDGYLYLFAEYGQDYIVFTEEETIVDKIINLAEGDAREECYIPKVQGEELPPEDIYIPEIEEAQGYMVGVSVALDKPDQIVEQVSVLMDGGSFYASQNNIYLTETVYDKLNETKTLINAFSYKDGALRASASGSAPGMLHDNFCMDEYNGYVRMVTTAYKDTESTDDSNGYSYTTTTTCNNLYVLDSGLQIVGKIEDLAEGETIYSARFMQDTGYFVTYRQMDPLFSVDLSDPENPVILGELKISGFSEYLHPYGENRLLGIGWEATDSVREGMKLSMFDISDPSNVQELDKTVAKEVFDMVAGQSYKGVLVNVNRNLFGFAVSTVSSGYYYYSGYSNAYRVYCYEEGQGFSEVVNVPLNQNVNIDDVRGVYIKDILYIADGITIQSVSLKDGSVLEKLVL